MHLPDSARAQEVLRAISTRYSREELAALLNISPRRIAAWERGDIPDDTLVMLALQQLLSKTPSRVEVEPRKTDFRFIDLFAGIGGTRMGFERAGGRCVFTSEYDKHSVQTYKANFRPDHEIAGDITKVHARSIPDYDVLVAGFPCQPFSIAGVSKKNALGRAHGFECKTQGTLFFDICRIIEATQPSAFMLENVRNLKSHDKGNTFRVIQESLRELGYTVDAAVIDGRGWVPQHRERIYIVGFRGDTKFRMDMVPRGDGDKVLADILHAEDGTEEPEADFTLGADSQVNPKYTLTRHLWNYLQNYKKKHEAAGNGFGFGLVRPDMIARTLSARYYKDGSEILIHRGERRIPRRLTPRECARLMGFPDSFKIPVSDTQAYKQFGNSVVVPAVEHIAKTMRKFIVETKTTRETEAASRAA